MLMITHAVFDLTALAIIHWDLESTVAQLIFKQQKRFYNTKRRLK